MANKTLGYVVELVNADGVTKTTINDNDGLIDQLLSAGGVAFLMSHQLYPFTFCIRVDSYATVWEFSATIITE